MLAHEMVEKHEAKRSSALNAQFGAIAEQVGELKARLAKVQAQLSDERKKNADMEERLEDAEDENGQLKEALVAAASTAATYGRRGGVGGGAGNDKKRRGNASFHARGEEIRKALLADDDDNGGESFSMDDLLSARHGLKVLTLYLKKMLPFKTVVRQIQARFGSSVASYYVFYRFLFLQFGLIALAAVIFGIMHLVQMVLRGDSSHIFFSKGLLPGFMFYSSFDFTESLNYSILVIIAIVLICATVLEKLVREDRLAKELDSLENADHCPYMKETLCVWDFGLTNKAEVSDLQGSIANNFMQMIEETKTNGVKKGRTQVETVVLYFKRTGGFVAYAAVQCAAFTIIVYLTVNAKSITSSLSQIPLLKYLANIVTPLALSLVNGVSPMLHTKITTFECW
jgi:hypothetical protein